MSKNKSIAGVDIEVVGRNQFDYPGPEVDLLDTNERQTGERFGIDFLSPCLGIIGIDSNENVFHGAHVVAPTGNKVEDFLSRYDPDSVVVTGVNYGEAQLEDHMRHEWRDALELGDIADAEPADAYEVAADGGFRIEDLSPVEDMLYKRGEIEEALEHSGTDYETAWAQGPTRYSVVDASIPEGEIRIGHL